MEELDTAEHEDRRLSSRIRHKAEIFNSNIPYLRRLPGPAIAIICLLVIVNLVVWAIIGIVLHYHPSLLWTAFLAWTLGLRHALDADHISCIDLMTRRLVASDQRPVTVGTFFSLGHSTIVVITCIVVAASSAAITSKFGDFSEVGGIIGSSISAAFLTFLGIINGWILYRLYRQLETAISAPTDEEFSYTNMDWGGRGCMTFVVRKLFKFVDRPWKMYPIGVIFGLGFDTSSEVALLGIASIEASTGTSFWYILAFPVLFTIGMCLVDTFDGAAMMSLYTSARLAKDMIAILYYQCVLTAITVVVAIAIGILQFLSMIQAIKPNLGGSFWHGVAVAGDNYDIIGAAICGSFIVFGLLSVLLYRPWRSYIDRKRPSRAEELVVPRISFEEHGAVEELLSLPSASAQGVSSTPPQQGERLKIPSTNEIELCQA